MVHREGYYEYMARRLREEGVFDDARGKLYELDMAELQGAYYNVLKRNKELLEEVEDLKERLHDANIHNKK